MYLKRTEGIVIKSYDFGEGHRVVVIFTHRLGKVRAVAKGSRKTKSKFGASLEPLTVNEFMLYRKPGSELAIITGADTLLSNLNLREDMKTYYYCALMLECMDILNTDDDPHPVIYNLFKGALLDIKQGGSLPSITWLFIFRLLKQAGYRLDFFECGKCSTKNFKNPHFAPEEGSVYCSGCLSKRDLSWPVSGEALLSIKKLDSDYKLDKKSQSEIGNIIQKFIKYEFGKNLKSMKFLDRILNNNNSVEMNLKKRKNVFSGINNQVK
ncbi:MAG: DNA repair protein RecO [Elusimicrobia bacterium]|jgi:DNA repair protein RecO (recombination protein O)|nr:DNA repair protein RecO [Elusimicrobiota bacterium]